MEIPEFERRDPRHLDRVHRLLSSAARLLASVVGEDQHAVVFFRRTNPIGPIDRELDGSLIDVALEKADRVEEIIAALRRRSIPTWLWQSVGFEFDSESVAAVVSEWYQEEFVNLGHLEDAIVILRRHASSIPIDEIWEFCRIAGSVEDLIVGRLNERL